jgi:hypothetical protein
VYRVLVGKPVGKGPRSKLEYNIKIDLAEIGWQRVYIINVAQGRNEAFVNTVMKLRVP